MNIQTNAPETVPAIQAQPPKSFFAIPGNPAVPKLVRVYGTVIMGLNIFGGVLALLCFTEPAFIAAGLLQLCLNAFGFGAGKALRDGRRWALTALMIIAAVTLAGGIGLAILVASREPTLGRFLFFGVCIAVAALYLPPILVSFKHSAHFK